MDKSIEYVKMSGKAIEIQKEWSPEYGDWCYGKCVSHCGELVEGPIFYRFNESDEDCWYQSVPVGWHYNRFEGETDSVWLLTQEQLQNLLKEYVLRDCVIGESISKRMAMYLGIWVQKEECEILYSMEQYLLAWLMYEKYNKVWTGTNWVEKGESLSPIKHDDTFRSPGLVIDGDLEDDEGIALKKGYREK